MLGDVVVFPVRGRGGYNGRIGAVNGHLRFRPGEVARLLGLCRRGDAVGDVCLERHYAEI